MLSKIKSTLSDITVTVGVSPIKTECCDIEYQDARSAVFYAMGRALKEDIVVAVLLPGAYLPSAYTAMTEAWFQKAKVIIFAFFDSVTDIKVAWADRCVLNNIIVKLDSIDDYSEKIIKCYSMHGPSLISVVDYEIENTRIDYSNWVTAILRVNGDAIINCYNSTNSTDVNNIMPRDKYGIVSKYIGMSVAKNCGYLFCTTECLLIDINVFRTRYTNGNMKIIVEDDGRLSKNNVESWISSNNWACKTVDNLDNEVATWFVNQEKQTVLIVNQGAKNVYTY